MSSELPPGWEDEDLLKRLASVGDTNVDALLDAERNKRIEQLTEAARATLEAAEQLLLKQPDKRDVLKKGLAAADEVIERLTARRAPKEAVVTTTEGSIPEELQVSVNPPELYGPDATDDALAHVEGFIEGLDAEGDK